MKRLARPIIAFGLAVGISVLSMGRAALATPFSDVPANHWAYQYLQALAADGIIDGYNSGLFNGNRPMTRYEGATMVARAVNKVRETGASKEDLDKLAKLVDAFRDELDSLGVRVTNLEDRLDYLDQKTKFAQSISMAADIRPNLTFRQRTMPSSQVNGTAIDNLINDYMTSTDDNNPLGAGGSGIQTREDAKITFIYRVTDQLTVSIPLRLLNFEYGGTFSQNSSLQILPAVQVGIANQGNFKNLQFTVGQIENMVSSRTGLAFRAPLGDYNYAANEYAVQPYQKGAMFSGTFNGTTDFNASFTRVDQSYFNTLGYDPSQTNNNGTYGYLFPVVPAQYGYTQTTPAGSPTTNVFNAGAAPLSQVYLTNPAELGSVYISAINGQPYAANGTCLSAGTACNGPATAYAFTYNQATNAVVFAPPVPAGTVITIAYTATPSSTNTVPQRYMINARVNQKIPNLLGGTEIGVTYTRIFDFEDVGFTNGNSGTNYQQAYQQAPVAGQGQLSDTVLGGDFQVKLPFQVSGAGSEPTLFGELAQSKYSPDIQNQAAVSDTAGVFGVKLGFQKLNFTLQYQTIGANYVVGDQIQFLGNPPTVLAGWRGPQFPDFFGYANNLAINQQFDNQFIGGNGKPIAGAPAAISNNPTYTTLYPIYNPFKGFGTELFSSFVPNQAGIVFNFTGPVYIGGSNGIAFNTRAQYQHLSEIVPDSIPAELYGPAYATNTKMSYDTATLGAGFDLPVGGTKATFNLAGTFEQLRRNDTTGFQYYPFNYNGEANGTVGATAIGPTGSVLPPTTLYGYSAAKTAIPVGCSTCAFPSGGSQVVFYPNYVNVKHYIFAVSAALPLTKELVLNASYNSQPFGGSYGTTLGQNISEVKTYGQANLTYRVPKTNSSVQFQVRNYHYVDNVVSSYNFNQNREDLSFSVRF